jgi:C_GCAxxG_C_C family probable redox protein
MMNPNLIAEQAAARMNNGYSCSEAVLWAGGQVFPQKITDPMLKLATPFAGGIGSTYTGLCGALVGGTMVIGGVYGRLDSAKDDAFCKKIAAEFFAEFRSNFDYVICDDLRTQWVGKPGQETCSILAQRTVLLLLKILDEQKVP